MAEQSQRSGEQALMERNPTRITAEPGKQELIIVREFDAPRDLVFRAYTDPELFKRWIGPRGPGAGAAGGMFRRTRTATSTGSTG